VIEFARNLNGGKFTAWLLAFATAVLAKQSLALFEHMPLFRAANRMNADNTYLLLEQQGDR
jgi:hypothetical protein